MFFFNLTMQIVHFLYGRVAWCAKLLYSCHGLVLTLQKEECRLAILFVLGMQESDHNVNLVIVGWSEAIVCNRMTRSLAISLPLWPDNPSYQIAQYPVSEKSTSFCTACARPSAYLCRQVAITQLPRPATPSCHI